VKKRLIPIQGLTLAAFLVFQLLFAVGASAQWPFPDGGEGEGEGEGGTQTGDWTAFFTGVPHVLVPGDPVTYTDRSDPEFGAVDWLWEIRDADGELIGMKTGIRVATFTPGDTPGITAPGTYDVTLTITNPEGETASLTRAGYLIVLEPGELYYADFTASPQHEVLDFFDPQVVVQFTDLSEPADEIVWWQWDLDGDGIPDTTAQNPTYTYTVAGEYDITLWVVFANNEERSLTLEAFIVIEEPEEPPAASLAIENAILDGHALVPLIDWVPLFQIKMNYSPEEDGPIVERFLSTMTIIIKRDPRSPEGEGLAWSNIAGPDVSDLLEFALFKERNGGEGHAAMNNFLDPGFDDIMQHNGVPYVWSATDGAPLGTLRQPDSEQGSLIYDMDFIGNGTSTDPEFPVWVEPILEDNFGLEGASYFVAVRTSATWRSQLTLSCEVHDPVMIEPTSGLMPMERDEEGQIEGPLDDYTPDFYGDDPEDFDSEACYSSSFAVWDMTGRVGPDLGGYSPRDFSVWNYPHNMYTPAAEYYRVRYDVSPLSPAVEFATGEHVQLRQIFALETWVPVIGINIHSTESVHVYDPLSRTYQFYWEDETTREVAQIMEVNVVFTDIGADPYGPPGNGGFNPRLALDRMTRTIENHWTHVRDVNEGSARGPDLTFNGVWLWHDTDNNGVFTAPSGNIDGSASISGDQPMLSDYDSIVSGDQVDPSVAAWEYVPFPPGGGDPWWKMKIRTWHGYRRGPIEDNDWRGHLEAVPDNFGCEYPCNSSEWYLDYFVVFRADSGYKDCSGLPGDGTGMAPGTDFRAFIEPRRYNPETGLPDGGIYIDSMIPGLGDPRIDGVALATWQEDVRWGVDEPWWPQRNANATTAKPLKAMVDVHDLVLTYESDNVAYARWADIEYASGAIWGTGVCLGYAEPGNSGTLWDQWMDPFGLLSATFLNHHSVGCQYLPPYYGIFTAFAGFSVPTIPVFDEYVHDWHQALETTPFYHPIYDGTQYGPRSALYPFPPASPPLPGYSTWLPFQSPPSALDLGEYPHITDWLPEDRGARLLKQHVDIGCDSTAILGINVAGTPDPVTINYTGGIELVSIAVAFWGPEFTPDDLEPLSPDGTTSGVSLWEDADGGGIGTQGVFIGRPFENILGDQGVGDAIFDSPVALQSVSLEWPDAPELIDLNGDGIADDLDNDGVVDDNDRAWVLTLIPAAKWPAPQADGPEIGETIWACFGCYSGLDEDEEKQAAAHAESKAISPPTEVMSQDELYAKMLGGATTKFLEPTSERFGDDLFVVIRTSEKMKRFEQFRAMVPATLPERTPAQEKLAGIQFDPRTAVSHNAFAKTNPDEGIKDFWSHDMLEANVPAKFVDLSRQQENPVPGGAAIPILGLDVATNRPELTLKKGAGGVGASGAFTVSTANWTPDAFAGCWLIDTQYLSYEILSNTRNTLTLRAGTPANSDGPSEVWRIVKNPTFLEEVTVEFYGRTLDEIQTLIDQGELEVPSLWQLYYSHIGYESGSFLPFDARRDLRELIVEDPENGQLSGVALYRDNDAHPTNRNGVFDPDIDIPVPLDGPPALISEPGMARTMVKLVFSTPGTDDWPKAWEQQANNRQWIPDTFGWTLGDEFTGVDFFVVIRAARGAEDGKVFQAGIVSWGPNTPTEPDPDTFLVPDGSVYPNNQGTVYKEFPWASRGVGFITYFTDDEPYYTTYPEPDYSGFNWVRSSANKQAITRHIQILSDVRDDDVFRTLRIDSVSVSVVPAVVPTGGFSLIVRGRGFGEEPLVTVNDIPVQVTSSTDTAIDITIPAGTELEEPVTLAVLDPETGNSHSRMDLLTVTTATINGDAPVVLGVSPSEGTDASFPVTVTGSNFNAITEIDVLFGQTFMPILSVSDDGGAVRVDLPPGGLPATGALDVTVRNYTSPDKSTWREDTLIEGFTYKNAPRYPCFIATAAYGSPFERRLPVLRAFRDGVLLKSAAGTALVEAYYRASPAFADCIANRPWLAAVVRGCLTPVVCFIQWPGLLLAPLALVVSVYVRRRRPRTAARAA